VSSILRLVAMSTADDLDMLLAQHEALRQRMPHAWNAFFGRFGCLRAVQLAAIPPILSCKNVLVTAPTAGGKTEAVIAPICERIARHRWPGLSVLIITPTRALVNDLYQRLAHPCAQMGLALGRKTTDHALGEEIVEQVLITTPESTESLLTFRREWLNGVHVVVLDEIHLLDGSPRGDQLRNILSRLAAYRHHVGGAEFAGLQRIAMSATVADPRRLADVYLGNGSEIVSVPGQRELEARVIVAPGGDKERAEAAMAAAEEFTTVHKILVFVNSRKQVDTCAGFFRCGSFAKMPVYGHHGSLSKSQREDVESRFKSDSEAICVATMTLEVGIDIGDIDLVVCMDPPFSLASFLQRIGRGCRRLNGRTRALCVARDRAGELMFQALIRQASRGMPFGPSTPFRCSVLVQQFLAYLRQVSKNRRVKDQFINLFASGFAPAITETCIEEVLADMVQTGLLDKQGEIIQPASAGWDFIESNKVYSNIQPTPLEVDLVDVDSGKVVATVASVSSQSGGIRVAGRSYELLPGGSATKQRVRGGGEHLDCPRYHARWLPYSFDIGASLASLFNIAPDSIVAFRVGDDLVVMTWLGRLLNSVLAHGMRQRGLNVVDGPFHLAMKGSTETNVIEQLGQAVRDVTLTNPLASLAPERMVDVGPHFQRLSPTLQTKAREDWLDKGFLESWMGGIRELRMIPPDSKLGTDLLALV